MGACTISKQTEKAEIRKSESRLRAYPEGFPKIPRSKCSSKAPPTGSRFPRGSPDGAGPSRSPPRFEERGGFGPKSGHPATYGPKSERITAETSVEKLSSSSAREANRLQIGFWRKGGMENRGKLFDWLTSWKLDYDRRHNEDGTKWEGQGLTIAWRKKLPTSWPARSL